MQKITSFLWFDKEAEEAAKFYVALFTESKVGDVARYDKAAAEVSGRPEGSSMTVSFKLSGQDFIALNGGPIFKFTPAISFFVSCPTAEQIDRLWAKLSDGGKALMELGKYPFSQKYGWIQDKFGLSWQLYLGEGKQKITPLLMFVGKVAGKAEEAMKFYTSIFKNSKIITAVHYEKGEPDKEENIKHAELMLSRQEFMAMDSSLAHPFTFTEAISFLVSCQTQEEVDELWKKLSAVPEAEQCGWLKDKYGVSWQIVPVAMDEMMQSGTKEQIARVTEAFLKMKKFDIKRLKQAYEGR